MDRHEALRRLDKKTRNKLRALLSEKDENVINRLADLRSKLGKDQVNAIEVILNNPSMTRAVKHLNLFLKSHLSLTPYKNTGR